MLVKVVKVGNHAAIALPERFLADCGLAIGDELAFSWESKSILLQKKNATETESPSRGA